MFDYNLRLVSMLGVLTIIVLGGLLFDYLAITRRSVRWGLHVAVAGIVCGVGLTLSAVLPENTVFGPVFSQVDTRQKLVALTFDDGPYPPYTNQLLDVLKEQNVKATFFLLGQNAAKHPDIVRRIFEEGHLIGNHTYNHIDLLKAKRQTVFDELEDTNQVLLAITGVRPHLVRPPHGFRDPAVLEVMSELGLQVIEWSVMSRDWLNPGVDTIVSRVVGKVTSGSIVLLHDGDAIQSQAPRAQTIEATRRIIGQLRNEGYRFVTVDDILATDKGVNK